MDRIVDRSSRGSGWNESHRGVTPWYPCTQCAGSAGRWQLYRKSGCSWSRYARPCCRRMCRAGLVAAAKETAEEFQRVLSAIFDALNLSEAQREMVPQVVPRVLELLIAHDPDGDGDGAA